jgi:uncharacterized protein YqcC (DUF446 family)
MSKQDTKQVLLLGLADEIESEMKKLNLWNVAGAAATRPERAFGADSMSFEEWLQQIFLPNLKQAALTKTYPSSSNVAVAAVRNLDGVDGAARLIDLLSRVDEAIETKEQ